MRATLSRARPLHSTVISCMLLDHDPAHAFMPYPAGRRGERRRGAAGGSDLRRQGSVRRRGLPDQRRLAADARHVGDQDPHGPHRAAPARLRRPLRRQDHHGRTRLLDVGQERSFRHAGERRRAGPHTRRLVVRVGFGSLEQPLRFRSRHRYGRLGPRAREPLRPVRHPPHPWSGEPRGLPRPRALLRHLRLFSRATAKPSCGSARCCSAPIARPCRISPRLLRARDTFALLDRPVRDALAPAIRLIEALPRASAHDVDAVGRRLYGALLGHALHPGLRGLEDRRADDRTSEAPARARASPTGSSSRAA